MKKKKNMIARLRTFLKAASCAYVGLNLCASSSAQTSLPAMEPGTTQQVHFLLEEPSISRSALHEIGQTWGQSAGAMVLALVEGMPSASLPWPTSTPSEQVGDGDGICILRASRDWWPSAGGHIHLEHIVVPSSTFPSNWANLGGISSVLLTVNGVEHSLEPDVPMALPSLAEGVTLTSLVLEIVLGNGDSRSAGLVLPTRSICPQPFPDLPPWPIESTDNPWWVGTFHEGIAVTGSALVRLGADGEFDSPVILCDGFDPDLHQHAVAFGHGDQNWETLWDCDRSYKVTLDSLHAIGKDVVFLDFADGTLDVRGNAALLQHVISLCNAHKTTAAPIAVIGVSMGGVIARMALSEMEINGIPHCTGLFVAFDSPMRGAYLPWSMLQAIDFFAGISAEAENLQNALQSTAAQQLLFLTPDGVPIAHANLQNELATAGLPEMPRCAAIVNSHPETNFPLGSGPLLQASETIFGWEYAHVQLNPLPGDSYHAQSTSSQNVTFDADIPNASWWFGEPFVFAQTGFCSNASPQIGKWPGSRTAHLEAFESALEAGGIGVSVSQSETMFIPSKSALDVPFSGQPFESPFDWVHTESSFTGSTPHCDLTNHHEALMSWVLGATSIDLDTYGHNWPHRQQIAASEPHLNLITIGAAGSAMVGNVSSPFEVELSPCTDDLTVDSLLRIGDSEGHHPGSLRIHAGQTLVIGSGATLAVGSGSNLIVEPGGQLQFLDGAQINVHGLLHIHSGGSCSLGDLTQSTVNGELRCEGQLSVTAQSISWCTVAAGGLVNVSGATFSLADGSIFQFEGNSSEQPDIRIAADALCTFTGSGDVKFFGSHLLLGDGSNIQFDGIGARFSHCSVHGESDAILEEFPQITSNNRLRISYTDMMRCLVAGDFQGQQALTVLSTSFQFVLVEGSGGGANVGSSDWIDSHLQWTDSERPIIIQGNAFNGGHDDTLPLISIENCPNATMRDNTIMNHREGLRVLNAQVQLGCNEFTRLETATILHPVGHVVMNGSVNGGNAFVENEVHIRCIDAPLPAIAGGQNEWGTAFHERFAGTAWAELGPGGTPAPWNADGNAWSDPDDETQPPLMNSGLTACNPLLNGQSIAIATDFPVEEANCSPSPHSPSDEASVKSITPCPAGQWSPNPTEGAVRFDCWDKSFSITEVAVMDTKGGRTQLLPSYNNQSDLNSLNKGVYVILTQVKNNKTSCLLRQRIVVLGSGSN